MARHRELTHKTKKIKLGSNVYTYADILEREVHVLPKNSQWSCVARIILSFRIWNQFLLTGLKGLLLIGLYNFVSRNPLPFWSHKSWNFLQSYVCSWNKYVGPKFELLSHLLTYKRHGNKLELKLGKMLDFFCVFKSSKGFVPLTLFSHLWHA